MSDSSDDEYEALRKRNVAFNKAILAELGIDSLVNDGKRLLEKSQEIERKLTPISTKMILPRRRSARIQKQTFKVKYVKGFRGFILSDRAEKLDKICYVTSEDPLQSFSKTIIETEEVTNTDLLFEDEKRADMCEKQDKMLLLKETDAEKEQNSQKPVISRIESEDSDNKSLASQHISPKKDKSTGGIGNDAIDALYDKSSLLRSAGGEDFLKLKESVYVEKNYAFKKSTNSIIPNKCQNSASENVELSGKESNLNNAELRNTGNVCGRRRHSETTFMLPWQYRDEISCLRSIEKSIQMFKSLKEVDSNDDSDDDDWSKFENIAFCVSTSEESDEGGEVEVNEHRKWRQVHRLSYCNKVPAIAPDEVTEEMLENIARRSSLKIYDHEKGTTCHQCRQKTLDTKTVCRSGKCVGIRGMFCGVCLLKRYGEKVGEALRNLMWECPVCRGICNCSFCRSRAGKFPTGIMYPQARQQGYKSVAEYLMDNDKENHKNKNEKHTKLKVVTSNRKE